MSKANLQTVADLRREAAGLLHSSGIESATLDVDVLLAHVLKKDRSFLLSHGNTVVPIAQVRMFQWLIVRRSGHEPIAHITGMKEFYGLDFAVNRHVLIPRPKTEEMVERAKVAMSNSKFQIPHSDILVIDVGTGSGILAITLKRLFPAVTVLAIDHSKRALVVARENAERHGISVLKYSSTQVIKYSSNQVLKDRHGIHFLHSDLLSGIGRVDHEHILVLANLPYVPTREIATLENDVKDFEPLKALDGGGDGLDLFRRLAQQIRRKFAEKNVKVLWECEEEQEESVTRIFSGITW